MSIGAPVRATPPTAGRAGQFGLVHLGYLLGLPLAGLCGQVDLGQPLGSAVGRMVVIGWLPTLIYVMALGTGYRLTSHPLRALLVVLALPTELVLTQLLVGGNVFTFLYVAAVLQVGAVNVGLAIAMLIHRPSGWGGALVGVGLVAAWIPYTMPLVHALPGWPLDSQLLLALGALTTGWTSTSLFAAAAERFDQGGGVQRVEFRFGHGPLLARLSADRDSVQPPLTQRWGRGLVAAIALGVSATTWIAWGLTR